MLYTINYSALSALNLDVGPMFVNKNVRRRDFSITAPKPGAGPLWREFTALS
jgi:hypothetical protein